MAIFATLSVVIWFSTGTLGIFATVVYVFIVLLLYCSIVVVLFYACGNIRHTEYGNNYHTIDFHTVL